MKCKIDTPEWNYISHRFIRLITMEKKKRQVNQVAETGHTVAANIKRLRGTMQYKQLAEKLAEIGRPIAELGLRKIESGERKVDVDDLMAFAIVFGVSPLTLLMPEYASKGLLTRITGVGEPISTWLAWSWGKCDLPLCFADSETVIKTGTAAEDSPIGEDTLFRYRANPKHLEYKTGTFERSDDGQL